MKALTLRQPWANAIVYCGKNIENRRWRTSFRGEFLIHAAVGMTAQEYDDAIDFCDDALELEKPMMSYADFRGVMGKDYLPRGGIVGRARLVDVIPPCDAEPQMLLSSCTHKWHMPEQFGFILRDIQPTKFVPVIGALQFWEVPPTVLAELGIR